MANSKPGKLKRARGGPPFIDRRQFYKLLSSIPTVGGKAYVDRETIYGDMSRLVVAWLAHAPQSELQELYNKLNWEGPANLRPIQKCAKAWFDQYHPGRLPK